MRKKSSGAVWGVMLILFGVVIGGRIMHWFNFNIFFRGWWSLFLIIPCSVRFLTERGRRMSALKGLFFGILLLMAAQGFIEIGMLFPLLMAGFFVMSGLKMLMPGKAQKGKAAKKAKKENKKENRYENAANYQYSGEYEFYDEMLKEEQTGRYRFTPEEEMELGGFGQRFEWNNYANRGEYRRESQSNSGADYQENSWMPENEKLRFRRDQKLGVECTCTAILCGKEIHFSKEVFHGAVLTALLGAVDIDLHDAVFYEDTVIEAVAVMGSIDITVPKNVHVVVSSTPVLGGVDSHIKREKQVPPDAVTIYIKAKCVMGGIDIK